MASQWIDAATARKIVAGDGSLFGAERSICVRAHAGMLNTRAKLFHFGEQRKENCPLPASFWWAEGHEALEQDWASGDFSTWLEHKIELRAFGVEFDLAGILDFLPAERRPIVARSLSVEASPDWLSARAARELIGKQENICERAAERRLIELAALGFAPARAVQMSRSHQRSPRPTVEREWDVPVWFWENCIHSAQARIDWTLGRFAGNQFIGGHYCRVDLVGVHFLRAALILPDGPKSEANDEVGGSESKPRLPDAKLIKWWDDKVAVRDSLPIDELWLIARNKFPDHHIARDRIRELASGRKRGPKPIGE